MKKQDESQNHYEIEMNRDIPYYSLRPGTQNIDSIEPAACEGHNDHQAPLVKDLRNTLKTKFSNLRNKAYCSRVSDKIDSSKFHVQVLPQVHEARNTVLPQNDVPGVNLTQFKKISNTNKFTTASTSGISSKCEIIKDSEIEKEFSTTTFIDAPSNDLICRICHEDDHEEKFISPCKCSGTLGLVHKSCLEKWLSGSEGRQNKCELCNTIIPVEKVSRPFYEYFKGNKKRRRDLCTDLFFIFFWIPMVVLCNIFNIRLNNERLAMRRKNNSATINAADPSSNYRINYYERTNSMSMSEFEEAEFSHEPIELVLFSLFTFIVQLILVGWILFSFWENIKKFIAWRRNNCIVRLNLQ